MIVMENWRIDFVSMGFIASLARPTMNRRAIRTKSAQADWFGRLRTKRIDLIST